MFKVTHSAQFGLATLLVSTLLIGCSQSSKVESKPTGTVSSSGLVGTVVLNKETLEAALLEVKASPLLSFKGVIEIKLGECDLGWIQKLSLAADESASEMGSAQAGVRLVFADTQSLIDFAKVAAILAGKDRGVLSTPSIKMMAKPGTLIQNVEVPVCGVVES